MRPIIPIVLNQATAIILGIVYVKLVNRYVPPVVNGTFGTFFVTLSQVAALVTHSGLVNHATRYWQRESDHPGPYVRFLFFASCAQLKHLTPLLLVICTGLALIRSEIVWIGLFPLLVLTNFALALHAIGTGALNADQSAWKFFFLNAIASGARTFFPIAAVLLAGTTLLILSIGYALHALLILICIAALFGWAFRTPAASHDKHEQWFDELKHYGRPFVGLGAGAWFLQYADRWVVAGFFDESHAGLFVVAAGLGAIVPTTIVAGLMQIFFPSIFRQADRARTPQDWKNIAWRCDQITVIFLLSSVAGLIALKFIAPLLVGPLISENYVPALQMLIPAGLAVVASQVNQFHYLLLQGQHNSAAMVKVMAVVAGIKMLGSVLAAMISWTALMYWMGISVIVAAWLGRLMIRKMALSATVPSRSYP